jgi:phage shock protein PspC (stress-responsive transcriptional regulator)
MNMSRLVKSSTDKKIFGVCGGLARRFNMDSTIIRLIFVVAAVIGFGSPIILYLVLALIIPNDY